MSNLIYATLFSFMLLLADPSSSTNLTGHALDPDGAPLANATILIYTASPKKGPATQNPTDYPDCAKSTATDAQGAFTIAGVDSSLRFEILVLADNFRPLLLKKVDPARGEIRANLKAIPKDVDADHLVCGRILDGDGKPVVGALVDPYGEKNSSQRWWGAANDVEDHTYTDAKGDFTLVCKKSDIQVDLKLTSRTTAPLLCPLASQGGQPADFTVTLAPGATVTGRLVKDGAPVAGATMKLCQQNRDMEHYVGEFSATTNDDGKFTFNHVKANDNYYLYATMKSLGDKGAVSIRPFSVPGDATTTDAGDITVDPAFTVSGQLVTSDGKPLPSGIRVILSREDAMDYIESPIGEDGKFQFKSIPANEVCTFSPRAEGYHVSPDNQSFEPLNAYWLMGKVDADIPDLRVQLDPGPDVQRSQNTSNWQTLRNTRLTGIPADK